MRPFSPMTPKRPHATLQVNVTLTRLLIDANQRRPTPGGDLASYHVRAIYADRYEDGEELTRARVKN